MIDRNFFSLFKAALTGFKHISVSKTLKYDPLMACALKVMLRYRARTNRPRSVYLNFYFFACGLFEKSVYSRSLSI